ncbi:hypothetical protein GCM10027093_35270 [Paraburkholderia jirisanensis]
MQHRLGIGRSRRVWRVWYAWRRGDSAGRIGHLGPRVAIAMSGTDRRLVRACASAVILRGINDRRLDGLGFLVGIGRRGNRGFAIGRCGRPGCCGNGGRGGANKIIDARLERADLFLKVHAQFSDKTRDFTC